jgi:putative ABC transport system ATP-binding protein
MQAVEFTWPGRAAFTIAIDQFAMVAGERVLLLGRSGSGKSTFLSLLCGIVTAQSGRLAVLGTDLSALTLGQRDSFRGAHIGIIFQQFNLLPYGSIVDNVLLPLSFAAPRRVRVAAMGQPSIEAARLLTRLGLDATALSALPVAALSLVSSNAWPPRAP